MKLGKVIGRVVCSEKLSYFDGLKLLLLQPIDEEREEYGSALVAFDTVQAGEGDIVMYEGGKEAAKSLPNWFNPGDASIIGIVDNINLQDGSL
ncbi:MAG: EutN/CcmL family microcompartment protein [Spirochaetaceae bacterium]|nr:EutN/CcmL family microcompartment protein [Spirochaetaceae bacterium]